MNQTKNRGPVWDRAHSTYMRIIYLRNGYSFTGYSKKYQQNERRDKVDLLTNWILRDLKNGYLDKKTTNDKITPLDRIEYFRKENENYFPVINLYYDFPEWVNPKWMEHRKFFLFVSRLYSMLQKNVSVSEITNALEVRTRASAKDPFDISFPRFVNMHDLSAYIMRLKSETDLESEAIDNFYRKYIEKYFQKQINHNQNPNP
jgi:hypothetical protein